MEHSPISSEKKRILIVGAGAVGQLIGCLMGQHGHVVSFLLKPGRSLGDIVARDLDQGVVHTLERPTTVVAGDVIDPPDLLMVTVRGDQVDAALKLTRQYLGPHTSVAVVPPLLHDLLPRVRKAGIERPTFAMLVGFGVWPVGAELHWFRFPGGACLLSGEGDPAAFAAAEVFVVMLRETGLPAHALLAIPPVVRAMVVGEYALLMGWELVGWDIDRLPDDRELCALTAAAMADAVSVVMAPDADAADRVSASMPPLELRTRSMSDNMRAIWRFHGPKIALQTRQLVDGLIEEARRKKASADSLLGCVPASPDAPLV